MRDGDLRGYAKIFRDRTREHETRQRLQAANRLLNLILDQSPDPMTLKDQQGKYLLCNRAAAAILGLPTEAILGRNDAGIRAPDVGTAMMQTDQDIMQSGKSRLLESVVSLEGEERIFSVTKTPLYDEQKDLIGLLGIAHDVTARNQAAGELQDRETRLSIAIEGAELGIYTWDMAERRAYWDNDRMYTLFGRDPALGPYSQDEFFDRVLHPNDIPAYTQAVNASLASGLPFHVTCRILRDDGQAAVMRFAGRFERDSSGVPTRFISIVADVTEAARAEAELRRHQEEIEAVNFRLVRAMRETHHRVKNNLQVIAALIEVQAGNEGETPQMRRVKQNVSALSAIHDLLTLQIKEGEDGTRLSARDVLRRLIAMLQDTNEQRRIVADIGDMELTVHQSASLALLINECVSNAIKHSRGDVKITMRAISNTIHLEICDDGAGFSSDFDPRRAANTGLELIESAARWDLRGDVRFENNPTGGGRVVITFPAGSPELNAAP